MGLFNYRNSFAAACLSGLAATAHAQDNVRTFTFTPGDANYVTTASGDNYDLRMQGNNITLSGSITPASIDKTKDFLDRLATNRATQEIFLILDSTGGSVDAGYDLVDHVNTMDIPVHVRCDDVGSMAFMLCVNDAFASARGTENSKGMFHFSYTVQSFSENDITLGAPERGWNIQLDDYRIVLNELIETGQDSITAPLPDAEVRITRQIAQNALEEAANNNDDFITIDFSSEYSSDGNSRRLFMTTDALQNHIESMDQSGTDETIHVVTGLTMTFTRDRVEEKVAQVEAQHLQFAEEFAAASILTVEDVLSLDSDIYFNGIQMYALGMFDYYRGPHSDIDKSVAIVRLCEDEPQLSICDASTLDVN